MKLRVIIESAILYQQLMQLRPQLAAAAQKIYDSWEPGTDQFDMQFGGGGICDAVAEEMSSVLMAHDIETTDGGHEGDDHAYLIAYDDTSSYAVDIPHYHYEIGGGMCWTKIPDVRFGPEHVEIVEVDRPDWIDEENYI